MSLSPFLLFLLLSQCASAPFQAKLKKTVLTNWQLLRNKLTPRGASDVVVVRHADGRLRSSRLSVHFGTGLFHPKMPKTAKKRVQMSVWIGGQKRAVEGTDYFFRSNGIVQPQTIGPEVLQGLLEEGRGHRQNVFAVEFAANGLQSGERIVLKCKVHFWTPSAKLVVSDIDGTVTRSDLRGMALGEMWIQPGVREFYRTLKRRGYQLVYLSARPSSMGAVTRNFLHRRLRLPQGALLLSPEPLGKAVGTAVRDPERVKIQTMQRVEAIFNARNGQQGPRGSPFFAGLGNQETDLFAYGQLQIPLAVMLNKVNEVAVYELGEGDGGGTDEDEEGGGYGEVAAGHSFDVLHKYFPKVRR